MPVIDGRRDLIQATNAHIDHVADLTRRHGLQVLDDPRGPSGGRGRPALERDRPCSATAGRAVRRHGVWMGRLLLRVDGRPGPGRGRSWQALRQVWLSCHSQ
jgi:hypothetical protein